MSLVTYIKSTVKMFLFVLYLSLAHLIQMMANYSIPNSSCQFQPILPNPLSVSSYRGELTSCDHRINQLNVCREQPSTARFELDLHIPKCCTAKSNFSSCGLCFLSLFKVVSSLVIKIIYVLRGSSLTYTTTNT